MPDIKVLERIAGIMRTWRPKTCFANLSQGSQGTLTDIGDTVTKGTYTSDSTGFEQFLNGETPGPHEFISSDAAFKRYTVHQEHVPSLLTFGELRVLITTTESPKSPSKRGLKVERALRTTWVECGKELYMHATAIGENDRWGDYLELTPDLLFKYALKVYRLLLAEKKPLLRSLLIGGRLDIGIDLSGKGFFVNELTRITNADIFSEETEPKPHDHVCKAFARALDEVFPAPPKST